MPGRILRINVKPKTPGERGIPKLPVPGARVSALGVEGDYNQYRAQKQGNAPESALLLMPVETLRQLNAEGWPVAPGDVGENFTTEGVPYDAFAVGQRWRAGEAEFEISKPCTPCTVLSRLPYVGKEREAEFVKTLAGRRGWHARVLREGRVRAGDALAPL